MERRSAAPRPSFTRVGEFDLRSAEFTTPNDGNHGDRERAKFAAVGLVIPHTDELAGRLHDDFSVDDYGYARFDAIEDRFVRACASARVLAAITGVGANLLEVRTHEHHVHRIVGPNGMPYLDRPSTVAEDLQRDELNLHIAGAFRAVGSALDCMAAVVIGVARLPTSIERADLLDVLHLDIGRAVNRVPGIGNRQVELWDSAMRTTSEINADPVEGWLDWALQMRNALTHRGRNLNKFLMRDSGLRTQVFIESRDIDKPFKLMRYEPHLDAKPWLTDVQANVEAAHTETPLLLAESAPVTLTKMREATIRGCESLSSWALGAWGDDELQAGLGVDAGRWIERPPDLAFEGFVPGARSEHNTWVMAPDDMRLVELAAKLIDEGCLGPAD